MGNTHTKLLAGAFSVLSVMQFFMVYDLSNQVNNFTVTAAVSSDNVRPAIMRLRFKNGASARITNRGDRQLERLEGADLTKIIQTRSVPTQNSESVVHDTLPTPNTARRSVPTGRGNVEVDIYRPMVQSTNQ